jgi:dTDP-4-amino-4,6-dideoxygalactose transaminase
MRKDIPFGKPIMGDEEYAAVTEVLKSGILVHGPRVKAFEADFAAYTDAPHALAVGSCTAGLHLAWMDLDIGPGDEVIVPAQTHTATAHAVEFTGAAPVFVDCDPITGNIDLDLIEEALSPRTKGICVVHYLGLPVDMDRVNAIARERGLFVLEDCALSIGARFKGVHTGLLGDAGSFSFYPVKHMTTAEGGMFLTRHADLAARIGTKRAFGVDRVVGERKTPGVYDVVCLGYNYRMNELGAALGVEQLKRIDGFLSQRRENYLALAALLAGVDELRVLDSAGRGDFQSSFYCLSVVLSEKLRERRVAIVEELKAMGVGTSVYYPRPVPHMAYYRKKYGFREDSYPKAAAISYGSIALPVGPHLDGEDMHFIATALKHALRKVLA